MMWRAKRFGLFFVIVDIIITSDQVTQIVMGEEGAQGKVSLVTVTRNTEEESDVFRMIRMSRYQVSGWRGYPRSSCVTLPYLGFGGR